jgi:hypothetical protein
MHQNIELKEISLKDVNDFFKNDPQLAYLGLSDMALDYLYHKGTIIVSDEALLFGVYSDNELIAHLQAEPWSDVCVNMHMYVSTKLHHSGTIRQVKDQMIKYLLDNTRYSKAVLFIPSACPHVIEVAKAFGLNHEGTISNCMVWRQKVVDMVIYGLDIKRI